MRVPSLATPLAFVMSPTRAPRRRANCSARSTSIPVLTVPSPAHASGTGGPSAAPAMLAILPASGFTAPRPSGWTRLLRNTTKRSFSGSIQRDVPVYPPWPIARHESASPRFDEKPLRESQPRARTAPGTSSADSIVAIVRGDRMCAPSSSPSRRMAWAKRARSSPVENSPAWPATPPILYARGSCTSPRIQCPSRISVGAARTRSSSGGRKEVSVICSGSKMLRRANAARSYPLTRRTISPSTMKPTSL